MTKESRRRSAANAIAITHMEGGEPSPRVLALLEAWIEGHITTTEMREAAREKLHGLAPPEESQ